MGEETEEGWRWGAHGTVLIAMCCPTMVCVLQPSCSLGSAPESIRPNATGSSTPGRSLHRDHGHCSPSKIDDGPALAAPHPRWRNTCPCSASDA